MEFFEELLAFEVGVVFVGEAGADAAVAFFLDADAPGFSFGTGLSLSASVVVVADSFIF